MGLMNFSSAPIEPKRAPIKKGQRLGIKPPSVRRRVNQIEATLYGDQLFKTARNPEKEIVVCFYEFTSNLMRVEKREEGARFTINYQFIPPKLESNKDDEELYENGLNQFLLYHFIEPIIYEFSSDEFKIDISNENVEVFGPFTTVEEFKSVICKILKEEYLQNKTKKLADLMTKELQEKLEKEQRDNEKASIDEQLSMAGLGQDFQPIECEEERGSMEKISEETEIPFKENEKEIGNSSSSVETGKPTASFLAKDVKPLEKKNSWLDSIREQSIVEKVVTESMPEEKPKSAADLWMEQFMKGEK